VAVHAALAAAATLIAVAFALSTLERWRANRRRHELAWTLALLLFATACAALWAGTAFGFGPVSFKVFYVAGAITNVPVLAVGTIYLLAGTRWGDRTFAATLLFCAFAAGWVFAAPFVGPLGDELPRGSEVFGPVPRILAAVGSGVGATVLIGGAVWSAARLLRASRASAPTARVTRRLAAANGLIALGTLVLSAGGLLEGALDETDAFAVSLVVGLALVFAGFVVATPMRPPTEPAEWLREALEEPIERTVAAGSERADELDDLVEIDRSDLDRRVRSGPDQN
jgi:hypothetical protein